MNIAILPARGASKRIKKKNIKIFYGNPIIFYPLKVLINSKIFNSIYVTSDDNEIINYVNNVFPNVITIKREKKLSYNRVKTITVIKNFIKKNIISKKVKKICCVYPATPLLEKKHLLTGLKMCKKYRKFTFPVISSYAKKGKFLELKNNTIKKIKFTNDKTLNRYQDSGQFYWGTLNNWIKQKRIIDKSNKCFILKKNQAIDINYPADWINAKKMFKNKY